MVICSLWSPEGRLSVNFPSLLSGICSELMVTWPEVSEAPWVEIKFFIVSFYVDWGII